jgi:GNAT superfamily N-acetyltransferase
MVRVEKAGSEQAGLVYELTRKAFAEYRDTLDPPSGVFLETVDDVQSAIDEGGVAVAWADGLASGAVRWEPREDYLYAGRLAVPPEARGTGVGSALMDYVEDQARAMRLPTVMVGVRSALPGNIAFFEKRGYFQIAEEAHPRNPTATSVTMIKFVGM